MKTAKGEVNTAERNHKLIMKQTTFTFGIFQVLKGLYTATNRKAVNEAT